MKERYNALSVISRTYRLVIQTVGIFGFIAPLYYLIDGIAPSILTTISAKMFDQAFSYANGKGNIQNLWYFFGLTTGIYIIKEVMMVLGSVATNASVYEQCPASFKRKLAEKFARLPLIDYEKPDVYDMCQKAKVCVARDKISAVYMVFAVIVMNGLGVVATLTVVASYSIYLLPVSLISVLPNFFTQKLSSEENYTMEKRHAPVMRRTSYLWKLLTSADSEKELHVYHAAEHVLDQWRSLNAAVQTERYKYKCKTAKYQMACRAIQALGTGISIMMTVFMVADHKISIGEFGACIMAFGTLQSSAGTLLAETGRIGEHISFATDFFKFMDLPETKPPVRIEQFPEEIRFDKVSFSYPSSTRKALSDINLSLLKGKRIALVGENGCGKSTLVKLLMGVYEPDEGEIYLKTGKVVYKNANISKKISTVLQDFTRYYLTLRENVAISDVGHLDDTEHIIRCLERIQAPVDHIDQRLGAQFGGREYSGGQWQRIAIARGLFRDCDFFILDEPTSALDPIAETEILKLFLDIVKGYTSIIVSHRIGLCRYVDEIVVMKQGRIVEVGSHDELLGHKGEYFRLYDEQSKWYRKEKED